MSSYDKISFYKFKYHKHPHYKDKHITKICIYEMHELNKDDVIINLLNNNICKYINVEHESYGICYYYINTNDIHSNSFHNIYDSFHDNDFVIEKISIYFNELSIINFSKKYNISRFTFTNNKNELDIIKQYNEKLQNKLDDMEPKIQYIYNLLFNEKLTDEKIDTSELKSNFKILYDIYRK